MDNKWHLCEEELPDEGVPVLVMGKKGALYVADRRTWGKDNPIFYVKNYRGTYLEVSSTKAWMYIPKFEEVEHD